MAITFTAALFQELPQALSKCAVQLNCKWKELEVQLLAGPGILCHFSIFSSVGCVTGLPSTAVQH